MKLQSDSFLSAATNAATNVWGLDISGQSGGRSGVPRAGMQDAGGVGGLVAVIQGNAPYMEETRCRNPMALRFMGIWASCHPSLLLCRMPLELPLRQAHCPGDGCLIVMTISEKDDEL